MFSFLEHAHPFLLLDQCAGMGPGASLSLLALGLVVFYQAFRSVRVSAWLATVGLTGHGVMYLLLGPEKRTLWLVAALAGSFLLLWILLTPVFQSIQKYLTPLLAGIAGIWLLIDLVEFGVTLLAGNSDNRSQYWYLGLVLTALALYFGLRLFRSLVFTRLSWSYIGTAFVISGLHLVYKGSQAGAYHFSESPLLYITLLTGGLILARWWFQDSATQNGPEDVPQASQNKDLIDQYQPFAGTYATHVFLILFTLATLYPVLWVVKMAATPQKGFSMGLNPLPPSLLNYLRASRSGDSAAAGCYSRAMVQNFRELLGVGEACYDQVCSVYRVHQNRELLANQKKICSSFATAWKTKKENRPAALQQWRQGLLQPMTAGPTKKLMSKLLTEVKYQQAKREKDGTLFWRYLLNSILVAFVTTMLGLLLACTAAYAFSRFRFPGRQTGLMSFLVSQMFPGTLMMIPLYILMSRLGLLDSLMGLSLVYSTTAIPFCVWMLKGYFDTIPKEIEEAALIDGASQTLIFWKIMMPLARPAIAVTALFSFMTAWNEFILAATFMNNETSYTLPVMLYKFVGRHDTDWGHFAAGAIIVSLPIIFLFFALQKNLVGGLTAGSVKG